ncbi:asparagine-linked glycosylation protein [Chamberlinius hualienensis]
MLKHLINQYFSFLSGMITTIIALCTVLSLICALLFMTIRTLIRNRLRTSSPHQTTVGFFHPYCNAGGGGERVLWCAIRALQTKYSNVRCVVYTGDVSAPPEEILARAQNRFNIVLPRDVHFVYLSQRKWVEAATYPHFTLLGQSIGSMLLGLEALLKLAPDVYFDTMGYAFTIPIFKYIGGCKVGCYVHYPTISTDMLQRVSERNPGFNNSQMVSNSRIFSTIKILYYQLFAKMYGFVGRCSELVFVNSSWTKSHVEKLWKNSNVIFRLYPPCDVSEFQKISLENVNHDYITIVSVGQFRPEKDHRMQIKAFHILLSNVSDSLKQRLRLLLIGSCRNEEDEKRVKELEEECIALNIEDKVDFLLNISFEELKDNLSKATIGLHTMWNEHFGIGVVECMAAGLVMVAHKSGGPLMDIVTDFDGRPTGYLADSAFDFACKMEEVLKLSPDMRLNLRRNARRSTVRFNENIFETDLLSVFHAIFAQHVHLESSSVNGSNHTS